MGSANKENKTKKQWCADQLDKCMDRDYHYFSRVVFKVYIFHVILDWMIHWWFEVPYFMIEYLQEVVFAFCYALWRTATKYYWQWKIEDCYPYAYRRGLDVYDIDGSRAKYDVKRIDLEPEDDDWETEEEFTDESEEGDDPQDRVRTLEPVEEMEEGDEAEDDKTDVTEDAKADERHEKKDYVAEVEKLNECIKYFNKIFTSILEEMVSQSTDYKFTTVLDDPTAVLVDWPDEDSDCDDMKDWELVNE